MSLTPQDVVRSHDRARRQRLVRLLALGVASLSLVLLPSVFLPTFDGVSCVALLIALVGSASAYLANRWQWVGEAGLLLLGGGTLGIAWVIAARAIQQGLTTTDLQLYWDGRDPQTLGSVYDVIAIPLVIQGLTAVCAWLGADGVRRSLLSATRADELALANAEISRQANELERQQRQLRDGIAHMQSVHTAFARGNFGVRAEIRDLQLQPLALSLNVLLSHMERMLQEQGQRMRIESSAHELATALRRMRGGAPYTPPSYTGTVFDEALLELLACYQQGLFKGDLR